MADVGLMKRFLAIGLLAVECLYWVMVPTRIFWIVYYFAYSAVQLVYKMITVGIAQLEPISNYLIPAREESGRAKGLTAEELFLLDGNNYHCRAPTANGGMGSSARHSRHKSGGYNNSNYTPGDNPNIRIETLWNTPSGSHDLQDPHGLYHPALIEPLTGAIEDYTVEPYSDGLDWSSEHSSPSTLSYDHFQGTFTNPAYLTSAQSHPQERFQNTAPSTFHPHRAITSPINDHNPGMFPPHLDSTCCSDNYQYGQHNPTSINPISPIRTSVTPPARPIGSDPYSPGGSRRTRRPSTCDICGKEVRRPGVLEDHMNSHTGQRPYGCPRCPRVFTTKSNMQRHIGNFHGAREGR
ncbi:unnamed protein product [Rhizoctonia solani]|uniref:C2H2-type domain-containing protein n=1 Tax=Rhizoctonia solani TaxID=456999 RepID=A0A8H2WQS5_9AGAM|nr:unnamed protein product [Rhizoctonia solani]